MKEKYYPWGGEFIKCSDKGNVAVVLLNIDYKPPENVAIYGFLKTENIGIEKIVANVISNPNIRYLIICGDDIKGHRSGSSLISLHKNGIDNKNKIINAPGAIPYIENLKKDLKRIKKHSLKNLEELKKQTIKNLRNQNIQVFEAKTPKQARKIALKLIPKGKKIVKSKKP